MNSVEFLDKVLNNNGVFCDNWLFHSKGGYMQALSSISNLTAPPIKRPKIGKVSKKILKAFGCIIAIAAGAGIILGGSALLGKAVIVMSPMVAIGAIAVSAVALVCLGIIVLIRKASKGPVSHGHFRRPSLIERIEKVRLSHTATEALMGKLCKEITEVCEDRKSDDPNHQVEDKVTLLAFHVVKVQTGLDQLAQFKERIPEKWTTVEADCCQLGEDFLEKKYADLELSGYEPQRRNELFGITNAVHLTTLEKIGRIAKYLFLLGIGLTAATVAIGNIPTALISGLVVGSVIVTLVALTAISAYRDYKAVMGSHGGNSLSGMSLESRVKKIKSILSKYIATSFFDPSLEKAKEGFNRLFGAESRDLHHAFTHMRKTLSELESNQKGLLKGVWDNLIADPNFQGLLKFFKDRDYEFLQAAAKESKALFEQIGKVDCEESKSCGSKMIKIFENVFNIALSKEFGRQIGINNDLVKRIKDFLESIKHLENEKNLDELESRIKRANKAENEAAAIAVPTAEKQKTIGKLLQELLFSEHNAIQRLGIMPKILNSDSPVRTVLQQRFYSIGGSSLDRDMPRMDEILTELEAITKGGYGFLNTLSEVICGQSFREDFPSEQELLEMISSRLTNNEIDFVSLTRCFARPEYFSFATQMARFTARHGEICAFMKRCGVDVLLKGSEVVGKSLDSGEVEALSKMYAYLQNQKLRSQDFGSITMNVVQRGPRWEMLSKDICRQLSVIGYRHAEAIADYMPEMSKFGAELSNQFRLLHELES